MKTLKLTVAALLMSAVTFGQWDQYNPNPNNDPANASKELLNPTNHSLLLIDHQSQMAFAVESQPIEELRNNLGLLSASAKLYEVPTVVTTVAEKSFSGPVFPEIREYFGEDYIDRSTMNSWEDKRVVKAVNDFNRPKLVIAGLWTEVCTLSAALSALEDGYDVYVVVDASGGTSQEAHDMAVTRMIQAGVKPITSLQYLLEIHRDWARSDKYNEVVKISKKYGGAYGLGIDYIKTMSKWLTGVEASEAGSGKKN
ncbi:hydrolase [Flagellimonas meridianipacifica]|uniref:Nicotinamidase-related amidase n=1 Tax=Flagellimonas meridianipacifica TaxID=1080225 RepID=A0A2T0MJ53_9FLAO|nr:hydrolase [Allomuricauda pacifica]PRX57611.1 nicotinamidase-related amidase [Allomuricauda pacifica]